MSLAWVFTALFSVVCLGWAVVVASALRSALVLRRLEDVRVPDNAPWPLVSAVVPAANEEATVRAATETKLASDYPRLEVVLVDDRSTDGTGAILDELAAADDRVRAVHVTELPPGWLGKVHAMHQGVSASTGEWVLLTDADVHILPDAVRRAITFANEHGLDHVGVVPSPIPAGLLLDVAVAIGMRLLLAAARPREIERTDRSAAAGVGAFNLVRRQALDRAGGFPEIRMEVADDIALGRLLKESGARSAIAAGPGFVTVQLYPSLGAWMRAMERVGLVLRFRLLPAIAVATALLLLEVGPVLGAVLPLAHDLARLAFALVTVLGLLAGALANRTVGVPLWSSMLAPLGGAMLAGAFLYGGVAAWKRGGLCWRGTLYRKEELIGGWRYGTPWRRGGRSSA